MWDILYLRDFSNTIIYIYMKNQIQRITGSQKSVFLKSASLVTALTRAFLGVNSTTKELSFSDHTHALTTLTGILGVTNGGTGVSSLDDLKTAMGVSTSVEVVTATKYNSSYVYEITAGAKCFIGFTNASGKLAIEFGIAADNDAYGNRYVLIFNSSAITTSRSSSAFKSTTTRVYVQTEVTSTISYGIFFY